ncbi:hypothetical protein [Methylovulum psychrotolerans]|uniref:Uncharacterized protein n=1 Tax=Methylovulum psychrotolerans TaxID=1704499 RepID=A0A1Z4BVX6_9GAMM|nr:hypothetical protein [Methylovulum psychrotolerans]ASF45403.1 hypothetical protein CEK71_04610 [Methylovulum psychrotolerans]
MVNGIYASRSVLSERAFADNAEFADVPPQGWAARYYRGLLALLPFSPIGITATDAPAPPKLIECCPGMPLRYRQAKAAAQRGECVFCSDIIMGFAAKYYLVW